MRFSRKKQYKKSGGATVNYNIPIPNQNSNAIEKIVDLVPNKDDINNFVNDFENKKFDISSDFEMQKIYDIIKTKFLNTDYDPDLLLDLFKKEMNNPIPFGEKDIDKLNDVDLYFRKFTEFSAEEITNDVAEDFEQIIDKYFSNKTMIKGGAIQNEIEEEVFKKAKENSNGSFVSNYINIFFSDTEKLQHFLNSITLPTESQTNEENLKNGFINSKTIKNLGFDRDFGYPRFIKIFFKYLKEKEKGAELKTTKLLEKLGISDDNITISGDHLSWNDVIIHLIDKIKNDKDGIIEKVLHFNGNPETIDNNETIEDHETIKNTEIIEDNETIEQPEIIENPESEDDSETKKKQVEIEKIFDQIETNKKLLKNNKLKNIIHLLKNALLKYIENKSSPIIALDLQYERLLNKIIGGIALSFP